MANESESHVDSVLRRGARRFQLFYVAATGARARVTHDVADVRQVLRWQGGHGGRVHVMHRTSDCSRLLVTAPEPVKQSVRLFLSALTHGKSVAEAEHQSQVDLGDPSPRPPFPSAPPAVGAKPRP